MSTKITDTEMTSDQTRHTAAVVPGAIIEGGPTAWGVSWLPGRLLLRDQAITAMTLAEVISTRADDLADNASRLWLHVDGWAAELGITGPLALAEASMSPEDHADMPRVRTLAFDGQPGRTGYLLKLDRSAGTARVRIDGETLTMPAAHLQYAGGPDDEGDAEDEVEGDEEPVPTRAALINVMTDSERATLLACIAGYTPEVFDSAIAASLPTLYAELVARTNSAAA